MMTGDVATAAAYRQRQPHYRGNNKQAHSFLIHHILLHRLQIAERHYPLHLNSTLYSCNQEDHRLPEGNYH